MTPAWITPSRCRRVRGWRASAASTASIVIDGVSGDIAASTVNGGTQIKNAARNLRLSTVNGRITADLRLLGKGQSVSLNAVNGQLELALPEDADANFSVSTVNGSITSEFPSLKAKKEFPVGNNLKGRLGHGSATVKANTVNGGIKLLKRQATEQTPTNLPLEAGAPAASGPEIQILDRLAVMRGSEAWQSGDFAEAFKLLMPAAQKGNPIAQHRIGVMYVMGQGVEEDFSEATRWFRKAAEQGQGESQFSMGLRYFEGQSVAQDDTEAARWFRLAAEQGVGMAASMLAEMYAKGRGVPQDLVEAYKWLAVAGGQIEPDRVTVTLGDLESKLTPDQLAEAQRRAKEFVPKRTGPADP